MTRSETISASTYRPRRPLRPRTIPTILICLEPHAAFGWAGQQRAAHRQRQCPVNGRAYGAGHERVIATDVVLSVEEIHCAEKVICGPQSAFATRCAMLMLYDGTRLIADGPAHHSRAQAPVKIFTIHKEALVEQTHSVYDCASNQHACPTHRVHFDGLVRIDVRQVVATKSRASGKQTAETRDAIE